jgi:hypothetical protein
VTPKRTSGERPLPVRVILPYLALSAASILPVLLVANPGRARGYDFWALLNAGFYLFVSIAVVALHVAENRRHTDWRSLLRFTGTRSAWVSAVAGALVFGAILHGRQGFEGLTWPVEPAFAAQQFVPPEPAVVPGGATVDVGVTTPPLARNGYQPWTAQDLWTVNQFERDARKHVSVVMWYADWQHSGPSLAQLAMVWRRGSIPEITWEPWDSTLGLRRPQPRYSLHNITRGNFDAYIRTWANTLAAFGHPVRLRFAQEMNGNWYPWGARTNGNRPGDFVRAWRHVHDIFAAAHATNVQWVWSPVSSAALQYYPGQRYVNRLGITCLNGGTATFIEGWRTLAAICGHSIQQLHALAPQLPVDLSEVASTEHGGSKAAWITGMFSLIAQYPEVKSFIWFNLDKQTDWPIESSSAAERAFRKGVQSHRYR